MLVSYHFIQTLEIWVENMGKGMGLKVAKVVKTCLWIDGVHVMATLRNFAIIIDEEVVAWSARVKVIKVGKVYQQTTDLRCDTATRNAEAVFIVNADLLTQLICKVPCSKFSSLKTGAYFWVPMVVDDWILDLNDIIIAWMPFGNYVRAVTDTGVIMK